MERQLISLNKVLALLKKQYESEFIVIWRRIKEEGTLKNKGVITIFQDIVAITYEEDKKVYKVSYNFNNKFWYKYVNNSGHGTVFSPFFGEDDIIEIHGEKYIDEKVIINWNLFSLAELGGLN